MTYDNISRKKWKFWALSDNVPLRTWRQMYHQHEGAVGSSGCIWISRPLTDGSVVAVSSLATTVTGPVPSWIPSVGLIKAMAYARKVQTTGELPWRNLRAARCSNKDSVATLVRKYIQTDGGLFEQPTYVAHYATVAVYLTAHLHKHRTIYISATAVKTTVVYTIFLTHDYPGN
jgi:hypothetical protein